MVTPDILEPPLSVATDRPSPGDRLQRPTAPAPPAEDPGRYNLGESTPWRDLIDSQATLPGAMPLEQVQQFFRENAHETFAAVLEGPRIIGLASELSLSRKLTASRGLGYSVYARTPLRRHLEPECLILREDEPVRDALKRVMGRNTGFFDDVILVDAAGAYLGLIRTRTLMLLQHHINLAQVDELASLAARLNENNTELERARDAATQAAEMKSTFLANMSHEIRTPLNGILGMVKILLRTPLAEAQRRYATTVLSSANALLTILNDILDFSKIEAGKMSFEAIDFDMADLAEEAVQLLAERAREKGLELFSVCDPAAVTRVTGDPTRIRQVLLNLATNAVKFTEKGQVVLRILAEPAPAGRSRLRVEVQDSGIGISPEVQARLFTAFEQGDRSTSRRYGGTGLGLAISKRIIGLLGGRMGCTSTEGAGSTFWFSLELPAQAGAEKPVQREDDLWGLRILVAHDNEAFAGYLEQNLARWKVVTRTTSTAADALEAVRAQSQRGTPFDLIIADAQLSGMDGLQFAAQVRDLDPARRGRTLLLTTVEHGAPAADRAAHGVCATLAKPVKPSELYRAITTALAPDSASSTTAVTPAPTVLPPVSPAPPTAQPSAGSSDGTVQSSDQERSCPPLNLLLVEDSEVNREVALILLQSWGHTLRTAENGRRAVEILTHETFDGVLMDCQMPEMDGYEATRVIRDPASPVLDHGVPIIAMTANAMPGDRERCLAAGMNDYVGKPIHEAELLQALLRCVRREASAPKPESARVPQPEPSAPAAPSMSVSTTGPDSPLAPPHAAATVSEPAPAADDEPYFPARLMHLFLRETHSRLQELEAAQEQGHAESLGRIAHTIKGTAGNFRAHRLYELARSIEQAARTRDLARTAPLVAECRGALSEIESKHAPSTHEPAA